MPGYEAVGQRRVLLFCVGGFQDPEACDFRYETMADWGRRMFVTPGIVVDGELVTTDLVEINLGMRILLGSSFYQDWQEETTFVKTDPLGNPIDQRHPWSQTTLPRPQKRDFAGRYSWVMSPRWYGPDAFTGIDVMRTIRSFDPCLPCGVHMCLGDGRVLAVRHSPTFGAIEPAAGGSAS